jgi:Cytochrome C oxidase, cbb3-type, subunit III
MVLIYNLYILLFSTSHFAKLDLMRHEECCHKNSKCRKQASERSWEHQNGEEIMKKIIVILAIMFLSALTSQAQTSSEMKGNGMKSKGQGLVSQSSPEAIPGAGIFRLNCASCHPNGGNVVTPNLPLNGSPMLTDFKTFLDFIRHPKMPDGSEGAMPAFTESKISDQQAQRLYQFITAAEGSGMMGGYGMGPGTMGGYGTGRGMMGGYGMGPGMMGRGYSTYSPECQKFYDDTATLRKELNNKRFEYFETLRNPKATGETAMQLDKQIKELQEKIYAKAPLGCRW